MLSILIPVYNYDVLPLVDEVYKQVIECNIEFEIIIIDDASESLVSNLEKLKSYSYTFLTILKKNIGRSAVRNLLVQKAKYENLLFIDAGTFPQSKTFISEYVKCIGNEVTIGGMTYEKNKPNKPYILRWMYTKKRETISKNGILTSANFLIKKSIILNHPFDESIKTYGYEDLIFFNTLEYYSIRINFIHNPVIHDCKDDSKTFIHKTEQGLQNLKILSVKYTELLKKNKIIKLEKRIQKLGTKWLIIGLFRFSKPLLLKNLNSSYPSIFFFDLYKLGYFCNIKPEQ